MPRITEKLGFQKGMMVEACKESRLNSIFKADSLDFGGFGNKSRKNTSDYCNLREILILCAAKRLIRQRRINMGNVNLIGKA